MKPTKAEILAGPVEWPKKEIFIPAVEQLFGAYGAWNKLSFFEEMSAVTKMDVKAIEARYAKKQNQERDGIQIADDTVTLLNAAGPKPVRPVK